MTETPNPNIVDTDALTGEMNRAQMDTMPAEAREMLGPMASMMRPLAEISCTPGSLTLPMTCTRMLDGVAGAIVLGSGVEFTGDAEPCGLPEAASTGWVAAISVGRERMSCTATTTRIRTSTTPMADRWARVTRR